MDLALYVRVIWRFRLIVASGIVLACALAFLSYARVSFEGGAPSLTYRQGETWQSVTRLLVTQPGFPQGRVNPFPAPGTPSAASTPVATPQWLASLAQSYEQLANSDTVARMLASDPSVHGVMTAAAEAAGQNGAQPLPILDINGVGATKADAIRTAQRGAEVFMTYFKHLQAEDDAAPSNQIRLEILNHAKEAQLVVGRKKTLPMVVLLTVMTATFGLAFILENLRPRIRVVADRIPSERIDEGARAREKLGA